MQFEVEQKHRLPYDESQLAARLAAHGATLSDRIEQKDHYFAHPCRNFAQTDEALRIRVEGGRSLVTYKGPKLDTTTKTRREIELPLHAADYGGSRFAELLEAIGFSPVAIVRKTRRPFLIHYADRQIQGAYDCVGELGSFVELELMSDEADLEGAKAVIAELACKLGLGESERRSYLEMLLEQQPSRGN